MLVLPSDFVAAPATLVKRLVGLAGKTTEHDEDACWAVNGGSNETRW